MGSRIKKMLEKSILEEFKNISQLQTGSKEKSAAIDDLATLYKLSIDDQKVESESVDRRDKINAELRQNELEHRLKDKQLSVEIENSIKEERLKKKQMSDQGKDRYINLGLEAASIIVPVVFYAVWMKRGFKFEETGTYTSTTFKGLFSHFRPTK
jgi:hypothetical protein